MGLVSNSAQNKRNYAIDVVKLLCCLVVLCSHSTNLVENVPEMVTDRWIAIGTPIVQLFFCISGYFMIESYKKNTTLHINLH